MANLLRRIRKLETRFRDATGLVRNSKEWFEHWYRKIDQLIAGDENVDLDGMTLEVIDTIIHGGTTGSVHDESGHETASQAWGE